MLTAVDMAFLRDLLVEETGIHLGPDKDYLFETRLRSECQRIRIELGQLIGRLRSRDAAAVEGFVGVMTTHETYFFREPSTFEALASGIIPALKSETRGRTLRLWSAGCSDGQEAYSLAMLMSSSFPEIHFELWATDVAASCIERARAGRYTQAEVNRGLPVTKLLRYFRQIGDDWQVTEDILRSVRFERRSILDPPAVPFFDVILCRNLLIYFDQVTKRRILRILRGAVRHDGYLLVGGSEHSTIISDEFQPVSQGAARYYRPTTARIGSTTEPQDRKERYS